MKKNLHPACTVITFIVFFLQSGFNGLMAQTNADFSLGNFTGWSGTYCNTSIGTVCSAPNPTQNAGFMPATTPLNASSISNNTTRNCQTLTSVAGGNDAVLAANGINMPVVWPGAAYSARLSSTWPQAVNNAPDAETMSYSFLVTPANCIFIYHFAVILNNGTGHTATQQPYFNISVKASSSGDIACGDYDVNATSAATIGGFSTFTDANGAGSVLYKPWSSVTVPLNNYIGQTVTITFTTRSCIPCTLGICCTGPHWAIAYISAETKPLALVASSPTVCGGQNLTLTAPAGAATYTWATVPPGGSGIVSGANTQVVTIDQPGEYVVSMTTFGNTPCSYSIDTFATGDPSNPVTNFSASTACAGSPVSFTDLSTATTPLTGWLWNFGDGSTANTQNPTHTYTNPGTYAVTLTATASPCNHDTTINVVVASPPLATFTATSPVCEGTNSAIQYTGGAPANYTYTWNFSGGTVASGTGQGPYQVNWSSGGNETVTLVVSEGTCSSAPYSQTVAVSAFPGLTVPPDTSVCAGGSVTLVAANATSYSWSPATGLSSTNTATVVASPAATTTYTVVGDNSSCSATATVVVTVNPIPTSTFSITPQVCQGQSATINYTGNAGAGATYTWNFNGGTATPAQGQGPIQVYWGAAGNQDVSLIVTENKCTSPETTDPVTIKPIPANTFTVSAPVCAGIAATVTYTGAVSGTATYTWGFSGGTIVSGTGAGPYTISWANAGSPNITLSVADNGCSSDTSVPVVVNAIPSAVFSAAPQSICQGSTTTLTYGGGASTNAAYTWNFAGGTGAPGGSVQGPQVVSGLPAGVDSIVLIVAENGCTSAPDTVGVTVNITPTSDFTASSPICAGDTSSVVYTGTGDNLATYIWDFGNGSAVPGTGEGPQTVTFTTAGNQNIGLVVTENNCTSQPTVQTVIVQPVPTATFTIPQSLCVNQPGTITYTGTSSPAATLVWGFDGGTVSPAGGTGPIQITFTTPGTAVVSLNITDGGCVATPDSIPVVVNPAPVANAGDDTAFCSGSPVILGTAATTGYTYVWTPNEGLSSNTASNPTVTLTDVGNSVASRTYVVTTTSNNCSSTDTITLTVVPVPEPQFPQLAPQCLQGNSFEFVAEGNYLPSASFSWNFGAYALPATSSAIGQTVTYTAATTSVVSLTITQSADNATCSDSVKGSVTVNPKPQANFQPDTSEGCTGFEVCFINKSVSPGGATYFWTFGDGGSATDSLPCHFYTAPGYYNVFLQATALNGCFDTITYDSLIRVIADPVAAFTPSVTEVLQPQSEVDFTNQSANAVTYLWSFSTIGVDNAVLGSSGDVNPVYNFTQYGLYNVMLYAYNALKCVDSAEQNITVLPPKNYFIPNAFTPNGDGADDYFSVIVEEGATVRGMKVFDRWGEKVYDGVGPWDGTYRGKPCQPGVYAYEVTIHLDTESGVMERKGTVTLIR